MRGWWAILAAVAMVVSGCAVQHPVAAPSPRPSMAVHETMIDGHRFSYCGTGSVDAVPAEVERVVIAVHGLDRDACGMAAAARAAGATLPKTLVIAPRFAPAADAVDPLAGLTWDEPGWIEGDDALENGVSSFAVLDALVRRVAPRPVVVVGFSGGGQFVNRYAAVGEASVTRYVVINPSSYVYFTPERSDIAPAVLARCPGYDDWRYGLHRLNRAAASVGVPELRRRYAERSVAYLIGTADDDPLSVSLDRSCAGMAQGANREERALRYHRHLEAVFGPQINARQPLVAVPNIAHDAYGMLTSPAGRAALTG